MQYYARLIRETEICLEQHDHYHKQSYRNRCMILGPNGAGDTFHPRGAQARSKTRMRDIRLDDSQPWRIIHWRSLEAAYASSPYYQFLAEELRPLYETMELTYLVEFNRLTHGNRI
ncbi:MAG: WbqC family protein [Bacteroidales bacterium]